MRGNCKLSTNKPDPRKARPALKTTMQTTKHRASAPIVQCPAPTSKNFQNLAGMRFGRLLATSFYGIRTFENGQHHYFWICQCDCGKEKTVAGHHLRHGFIQSCGCYKRELTIKQNTTHGRCFTKEYKIWIGMLRRCSDQKCKDWRNYGGRGIRVSESWKKFINFFNDMQLCPKNHTLERLDVNGLYEKSNCVWATYKQQGRNRRNNTLVTYGSVTKCVAWWAEATGIPKDVLFWRLKRWTVEKALTTPVKPVKSLRNHSEFNGVGGCV